MHVFHIYDPARLSVVCNSRRHDDARRGERLNVACKSIYLAGFFLAKIRDYSYSMLISPLESLVLRVSREPAYFARCFASRQSYRLPAVFDHAWTLEQSSNDCRERLRLRLLRLVVGLKIWRQFFNQWEAEPKPIASSTREFSRAWSKLQVIAGNYSDS